MSIHPFSEIRVLHHVHMATHPPESADLLGLSPEEIEARKVLAQNLQRLMAARPKLNSNPKLGKKAGVGVATLSRIMSMKSGATLDTIVRLAGAFGMTPWQMLVPGLSADNPQILQPTSPTETRLYQQIRELVDAEIKERGSDSGVAPL